MKLEAKARLLAGAPGGEQMGVTVRSGLGALGVPKDVIDAIAIAMLNSGVDVSAQAYAHGMATALAEYGIEGVKHQVMYLLINLGRWRGEQARSCKKLLSKWTR